MAVSRTVIAAYKRVYTFDQLREALGVALHDRASGVLVTNISFADGGGSGTPITGDPNEIIEILELCLQEIESGQASGVRPPLAAAMNFNTRRCET